ncbi:MAG: hypothetical protein NTW75_06785 [Planctomycetales bacterium]|jgi:hypothetical protein|nr:hypothetical protein [Planctomycetales bacterium]
MTVLHWIGDSIRSQLLLVPLSVARWLFLGLLLVIMAWVVQLAPAQTTPRGRSFAWYEDLKIWAWLALLFQVVVYSIF